MPRSFVVHAVLATMCLAVATTRADPRPPAQGQPSAALFEHFDGGAGETPGARYLKTLTQTERAALAKDGLVIQDQQLTGGGAKRISAAVRFNRPVAEVYALLTRPSDQSLFLPNVTKSKTVGVRTEEADAVDYEVSMVVTIKFRTQHWFYPEQRRIEWFLDPTGADGLLEQSGSWQLYALDEGSTVAQYTTRTVINGGVFDLFRGIGERGGIRDSLVATRRHVHTSKL